jgi:hypothetical protein
MADPLVTLSQIEAITSPSVDAAPPKGQDVKDSIRSWLGVEPDNKEAEFIMEQIKGDSIIDALSELKDIERRIGPAKFGEDRTQRLYNYVKLLAQFKGAKRELEQLERG